METEAAEKELPATLDLPCLACGEPLKLALKTRGKVFVYKAICPACEMENGIRGVRDK